MPYYLLNFTTSFSPNFDLFINLMKTKCWCLNIVERTITITLILSSIEKCLVI